MLRVQNLCVQWVQQNSREVLRPMRWQHRLLRHQWLKYQKFYRYTLKQVFLIPEHQQRINIRVLRRWVHIHFTLFLDIMCACTFDHGIIFVSDFYLQSIYTFSNIWNFCKVWWNGVSIQFKITCIWESGIQVESQRLSRTKAFRYIATIYARL